jgi:hypothetical protein
VVNFKQTHPRDKIQISYITIVVIVIYSKTNYKRKLIKKLKNILYEAIEFINFNNILYRYISK